MLRNNFLKKRFHMKKLVTCKVQTIMLSYTPKSFKRITNESIEIDNNKQLIPM